jgi:gamma-glutamylcyclotransferase (GGCT)/AIG2-like uncharacterized protein YtfP
VSNPSPSGSQRLRLFVYGTLRTDGRHHGRFCAGALSADPASIRGRVHLLPAGYPVLIVSASRVLADGTADPSADVETQARAESRLTREPDLAAEGARGPWREIAGEILTFDDPRRRLPAIDEFEDFHPGAPSLYRRVLLAVRRQCDGRIVPAWAYVGDAPIS